MASRFRTWPDKANTWPKSRMRHSAVTAPHAWRVILYGDLWGLMGLRGLRSGGGLAAGGPAEDDGAGADVEVATGGDRSRGGQRAGVAGRGGPVAGARVTVVGADLDTPGFGGTIGRSTDGRDRERQRFPVAVHQQVEVVVQEQAAVGATVRAVR